MNKKTFNRKDLLLWQLGERVKELTALHQASAILQNDRKSIERVLREFVAIIPAAWQYPEDTGARIVVSGLTVATPNYRPVQWMQTAYFGAGKNKRGRIEVVYLSRKKPACEGPFLKEERQLIDSLAKMLDAFYQKRLARLAIQDALDELEEKVAKRTALLNSANLKLKEEISERRRSEQKVKEYQQKLKRLASELSLTEERERRTLASDLHDHIGQALALIRIKLKALEGNAIFSGAEREIEGIRIMLEQTIRYTRSLTFELSPPVLYELGIESGLEWLAEHFRSKYGLRVRLETNGPKLEISNDLQVTLFRSARELMFNIIKHARASQVIIILNNFGTGLSLEVSDDGRGLPPNDDRADVADAGGYGLFSIREQIGCFGGKLTLSSGPDHGTRAMITCPIERNGGRAS